MATPTTPRKLRVGVMMEAVQFSDIIGVDMLGNMSTEYFNTCLEMGGDAASFLVAFASHHRDIEFLYLATTMEPARVTAGMQILPTVTYDECPRDLDMVLIGGPFPGHRPPQADRFIKEAWTKTRVWITTCTGSLWLASAGVVEGKKCTTNRGFLPLGQKLHPGVQWQDQRWVVEEKEFDGDGKGELWTAGGAGAGVDMIANYLLQNFDQTFVKVMVLEPLQFNPNNDHSQFYPA